MNKVVFETSDVYKEPHEKPIKVFVINLKNRKDRREWMKSQLDTLGVKFEFFDAISPKTMPEHIARKFNDSFRRWFRSRPLGDGEKACYASHYSLWCKCLSENKPIIILEDDSHIRPRFFDFLTAEEFNDLDYACLESKPLKKKEF